MASKKGKKIDFKYNISIYFKLIKKYNWLFFFILLAVLLAQIGALAEKFLFKIVIDRGTEFAAGTLLSNAYVQILLVIAAVYIGLIIFSVLADLARIHLLNRFDSSLIHDLKHRFFNHLIDLDYKFHTNHKSGSLISRLMRGAGAIERFTDTIIFDFAPLLFQLLVISGSLLYLDMTSAIIITVTFGIFVIYTVILQRRSEESNLIANQSEDVEKANIADIFTNVESIKYFGKEGLIKSRFNKLIKATRENTLKNWDYFRIISAGQVAIIGIGTFALLYFSITGFLDGRVSLGTLAFIYTAFISLIDPLFGFVHGIRSVSRAMADFQDLFEYEKIEREIKDRHDAKDLKINNGRIEFRNVTFRYGRRKMFENFNLVVPENKKIAFVGHSGSGKSTLIKLLYRFYDTDAGEVLIDNQSVRDFKQESLRSEMSIVPQECVLFDDTVYNNVAFSNPKASKEEVLRAIKFAQLDKTIDKLPLKEKTIVGERGVKLSGGEKQRVSIARAILANKKILVLDEATSALDSQTEFDIKRDLETLMKNRTSIIIAHRLSTIMNADRIIVMKDGKVVQAGTHNQLIKESGEYRKLWRLQKGGYM